MTVKEAFIQGYQFAKEIRSAVSDLEAAVYLALCCGAANDDSIMQGLPYPGLVDAFIAGSREPAAVATAPVPDTLMGVSVRKGG